MTNIARLPLSEVAYARITDRQRAANITAEGQPVNVYTDPRVDEQIALYETYRSCKAVVNGNDWYAPDVVHSALAFIHEYESFVPAQQETSLEVLKRQGVRPVLVYAILFTAVGYAALLGMLAL
jgi:hypothetical protein